MFKPLSLCLFILLLPFLVSAQRPGPGSGRGQGLTGAISGTLSDSITGLPLEYVSVGILRGDDDKVVNGSITDDRGNFRIGGLPAGQYLIQVSFIGYASKTLAGVRLTPQRPDYNAGIIFLIPEDRLLEEIKVVGEAALIEAKPDKIVYNAERDVTSRGGDAADVLRKVPLLTVDFDGNVSMRGSENIRVLINGRPSTIFNSNLADALKMMPSDQIKVVEVITSPSAKYDGEGTAGIINIITRKKNIEGLAGSVDLTGGSRHNRGNINLNYGKGRLGMNVSGGGHYSWPQTGTTEFRREEESPDGTTFLVQDGSSRSSRLGYRTNAGLEYTINAASSINSSMSVRGYNTRNENNVTADYSLGETLIDSYQREVDGKSTRAGWEWELDYKRVFPVKDREWSVALELDRDLDHAESEYDQAYFFPADLADSRELNVNEGNNLEITLQTDYVHPFNATVKIETGLKATLRNIESDFDFERYDADVNSWVIDPSRTDVFFYDQNVYAGYISSNIMLGPKTTMITGLRLETTDLAGAFEVFDSPFENLYTNLLPNITMSKKVGEYNQLRVSYTQRIQRPNQRHINPYVEYNDNRDISFGNPNVSPELVHQVELSTTIFLKGNMVSMSLFGRRTEDLIEHLLRINDDGISESTYENFGSRNSIGVNIFGTLNLGDLSLRGGFDVNAWEVSGLLEGEELSNSGFEYNGRLNATWTISETLKAESFGFFRSPTFTVQGKNPNWSMFSLGVKKELFNKKLSVGINISQPFSENQEYIRELTGTEFYQFSRTIRPVRSFGVNLGYRFGKLDFNERSGKKKVNNNDLKEEENGSDGQFNN